MIRFACPGCSATFTVGDEKAGKTGKCPKCQTNFVIPGAPAPAADRPPPQQPPQPAADGGYVELDPCPECGGRLSVAVEDLGADVECPYCNTVFTATRPGSPPPPPPKPKGSSVRHRPLDENDNDRPSRRRRPRDEDGDDDRPIRRRAEEADEDRPSRRRPRPADDDEDDRLRRRPSRDADEDDDRPRRRARAEDEEDRPRRRSRNDDFDDDFRPRRRKRTNGVLLALGIVNIVFGVIFLPCGGVAIAKADISEVGTALGRGAGDPRMQRLFEQLENALILDKVQGGLIILAGVLFVVGGIGLIVRKQFGKIAALIGSVLGGLALLVYLISIVYVLTLDLPNNPLGRVFAFTFGLALGIVLRIVILGGLAIANFVVLLNPRHSRDLT